MLSAVADAGTGVGTEVIPDLAPLPAEDLQTMPTEVGDHDRFAHFVKKEKIVESAVTGTPVIALCGKVWVPGRDPQRFPVCPECQKIYDSIPQGRGRGDAT
jgi:hypothetical protein